MVKHPSEFTFHDQKLPAYQLATEILNAVGIRGGIMNAIHDLEKGTFHYQSDLKLAQYDLIYGKQLLASVFPQHKTEEIKFGIEPLTIHSIMKTDHHLVIKGSGFNGDSQVFIDGKRVPTTYISEGELHAEMKMNKGNLVTIKQISGYHQALDEGKSFELAKINS